MKNLFQDEARGDLARRLRQLEPDRPRRWGTMSAHQMVCHLADSFRMGLGEKDARPVRTRLPRVVVKWVALWAPLPWPKGFPGPKEIRQGVEGTPPAEWREDVEEVEELMERFCRERRGFGAPHPVFGPLSPREWGRWGWLHTDHHLRQFGL